MSASTLLRPSLESDHQVLYDVVADFAASELSPHALQWDQEKHFPIDVLRKGAELGLGGVMIDPAFGGSGLSRLEATIIFEAMALGCPSLSAYTSIHNMVATMIDRFGTEDQRARYLPSMCSMELLSSYCLTEPDAGSDAAALRSSARLEGDHYVLNGVKQFISGAGAAGLYLVMARTGGTGSSGITAFLIDADTKGLSFGPNEHKMGWNNQPTRQVLLDDVIVPATNRLGEEGAGFKIAMMGLDGGRLSISACSLGGATAALRQSQTHLLERQAFGGPLANQQSLRFTLADMAIGLEASRLMVHRAAQALDEQAPDATVRAAMAKRFATDTCFDIANHALQLHGGYGYLSETGIEKIVRDLRVHQILEGTNEIMRLIVSRDLLR